MTPDQLELGKAILQGGATAAILTIVIVKLFPRLITTFEKAIDAFREQMAAERAANQKAVDTLALELKELRLELKQNTIETAKTSHSITRFRSSVTNDLPGALHRALITGDLPTPPVPTSSISEAENTR